jgi:hypothetical protein
MNHVCHLKGGLANGLIYAMPWSETGPSTVLSFEAMDWEKLHAMDLDDINNRNVPLSRHDYIRNLDPNEDGSWDYIYAPPKEEYDA